MVSVRIAGNERKLDEVDAQWVREQLGRRLKEGKLVCIRVVIQENGVDMALGTPACAGGGGGRTPNPREREILNLWGHHKLNSDDFSDGQVIAFLNQLRHLL